MSVIQRLQKQTAISVARRPALAWKKKTEYEPQSRLVYEMIVLLEIWSLQSAEAEQVAWASSLRTPTTWSTRHRHEAVPWQSALTQSEVRLHFVSESSTLVKKSSLKRDISLSHSHLFLVSVVVYHLQAALRPGAEKQQ